MAISPKDLYILTPEDTVILEGYEKIIDEKIKKDFQPNTKVSVSHAELKGLNFKLRDALSKRYTEAGWVVTSPTINVLVFSASSPAPEVKETDTTSHEAPTTAKRARKKDNGVVEFSTEDYNPNSPYG